MRAESETLSGRPARRRRYGAPATIAAMWRSRSAAVGVLLLVALALVPALPGDSVPDLGPGQTALAQAQRCGPSIGGANVPSLRTGTSLGVDAIVVAPPARAANAAVREAVPLHRLLHVYLI